MLLECCWQYRDPPGASLLLTFCCSALSDFCSQISHQYLSLWGYFHILGGLKYQHTNRGKKGKKNPSLPSFIHPGTAAQWCWSGNTGRCFSAPASFHRSATMTMQRSSLEGWWGDEVKGCGSCWDHVRLSRVCAQSWTVGVDLWWCNTAVCCLKRFFPMSAQLSHLTPDSTLPPPPLSNGLCEKKSVLKCYLTQRQKPWNEVSARGLKWLKSQTALEEFHRAAAQLEVSAPPPPPPHGGDTVFKMMNIYPFPGISISRETVIT